MFAGIGNLVVKTVVQTVVREVSSDGYKSAKRLVKKIF